MIVQSILGERREVARVYEDGSYTCPFCGAAVMGDWEARETREGYAARCRNPVCVAGPTTIAAARQAARDRADLLAERERRERDHKAWQRRMDEARDARIQRDRDLYDEAEREGY